MRGNAMKEATTGRDLGLPMAPTRRQMLGHFANGFGMLAFAGLLADEAFARPSMGSWLLYGLGSENQNLPGFIVISPSQPAQGAPLWSSSFLPAAYQGTLVSDLKNPIANLKNATFSLSQQRSQLDALKQLNELHRRQREEDSQLSARIESFELAY